MTPILIRSLVWKPVERLRGQAIPIQFVGTNRAQLRQHEASEDAVFTIGLIRFQPSSKPDGQQGQ
jgi:hypothetical protein